MREFLNAIGDGVALSVIEPYDAEYMQQNTLDSGHPSIFDVESLIMASESAYLNKQKPDGFKPRTRFGKLLIEQIRSSRYDNTKFICCHDAEPTLMQSLGIYPQLPQSLQDLSNGDKETPTGPLVCIVDGNEVVAVQKNHGEPSIYALRTREDLGLVERTFSGSIIHCRPRYLDANSSVVVASTELYGTFYPLRQTFSVFSDATKEAVESYTAPSQVQCQELLAFNHGHIVQAVKRAAKSGTIQRSVD